MSLKEQPEKFQPYLFHGVDIRYSNDGNTEACGICPFCGSNNKFYINRKTGQFTCHMSTCGKNGNIYTFLSDYWSFCNETNTRDEELQTLADERGVRVETLRRWRVARGLLNDEWIVAGYSPKGTIVNLYRWAEIEGKNRLLATPGCSNVLFGLHLWNKNKQEAHICEGIWDAMAYWERLGMLRVAGSKMVRTTDTLNTLRTNINVVAVAGYRAFNAQWSPMFTDLSVGLLYHSDHPKLNISTGLMSEPAGYVGMKATYQALNGVKEAKIIDWGPAGYKEDAKDGYDIRDICRIVPPTKIFDHIKFIPAPQAWKLEAGEVAKESNLFPQPCYSFKELTTSWRKALKWTDELHLALSIVLAVVTSTQQKGDQLWLRIIGPPGIAKTRLCDAICVSTKYCYPVGLQKGFHSGYKGKGEDADVDYSLIAKANCMTLVTKEGDTLLSSPMLSEILSQGRDVYDGNSSSEWRNRKDKRLYSGIRMTWIIAGTKSLRKLNRSNLGDRFIDYVINKPDENEEDDILTRAINLQIRSVRSQSDGTAENQLDPRLIEAYKLTGGYVEYLREKGPKLLEAIECPGEVVHQCKRLAQFVAFMRARPDKEEDEVDHESELPTRLSAQFTRLAYCLTVVLNKTHIDDEVMQIVLKSAMSTAHGINLVVVEYLARYTTGLDVITISEHVRLSDVAVRKACRFMHTLGIVRPYKRPNSKGKGTHRGVWELSMPMRKLYREIMEFHGEQ